MQSPLTYIHFNDNAIAAVTTKARNLCSASAASIFNYNKNPITIVSKQQLELVSGQRVGRMQTEDTRVEWRPSRLTANNTTINTKTRTTKTPTNSTLW